MPEAPVLLRRADGVHRVMLNRPGKRNALNGPLLSALTDALADTSARVFVLSGAGGCFSVGYDIEEIRTVGVDAVQATLDRAVRAVEACHCPIVALVEGHCLGAAVEVLSASDIRIAGQDARIGIPSNRLAMLYAPDGLVRLHRALGDLWSRYLLLTGETVGADRLLGSFLHDVVPGEALEDRGAGIARTIAEKCGPLSVGATRRALGAVRLAADQAETRALLASLNRQCATSRDAEEALKAFAEKRPPRFEGW